jgi:signal peptidase I
MDERAREGSRRPAAHRPRRRWRRWLVGALPVALLLGAVPLVKAHVLEPFRSPTGTMQPTLVPGDRFLVDKRRRPLRRGDVVVFRVPPNLSLGHDLRVKRAVALAGDTVELRAGTLIVNGLAAAARPLGPAPLDAATSQEWEETLDGRRYRVLRLAQGKRASFGPVTVPAGHFFMLGDNRDGNNDSRVYRSIPTDMILGRATRIWWSRAPGGGVRWERLGRGL